VPPHLDAASNLARWLVGDPSLAQDVVQDAAVRALTYFATYRGGDARAWFLRIVRNTAMTSLAKRSGSVVVGFGTREAETEENFVDPRATPEESLARDETRNALDRALAALPLECRECVVLRELEELSYRDIAEVTGVPIGTVMSRLWRARQMLARALEKDHQP
jgi:RNA polymerase sigma factor (sigma-70 family)